MFELRHTRYQSGDDVILAPSFFLPHIELMVQVVNLILHVFTPPLELRNGLLPASVLWWHPVITRLLGVAHGQF